MARKKATPSGPLGWYGNDPCPFNPVLTAVNTTDYCMSPALDAFTLSDIREVQTVGHADIFDDTNGNWWAVALATRNGTANL
jgi:hypothetical protein